MALPAGLKYTKHTENKSLASVKGELCDHQNKTKEKLNMSKRINTKLRALHKKVNKKDPLLSNRDIKDSVRKCVVQLSDKETTRFIIDVKKKNISIKKKGTHRSSGAKKTVDRLIAKSTNTKLSQELQAGEKIIEETLRPIKSEKTEITLRECGFSQEMTQDCMITCGLTSQNQKISTDTLENYLHIKNLETALAHYQQDNPDDTSIQELLIEAATDENENKNELLEHMRTYIQEALELKKTHDRMIQISKHIYNIPGATQARDMYEKINLIPLSLAQVEHIGKEPQEICTYLLTHTQKTSTQEFYTNFTGLTPESLKLITSTDTEKSEEIKKQISSRRTNHHIHTYRTQNTRANKKEFDTRIATATAALPIHNEKETDISQKRPDIDITNVLYTSTGFTYMLKTPLGKGDSLDSNQEDSRNPFTIQIRQSDAGHITCNMIEDNRGQPEHLLRNNLTLTPDSLSRLTTQQKTMARLIEHLLPDQLYTSDSLNISEEQKTLLTALSQFTSQLSQGNLNKLYETITSPRFSTRLEHSHLHISLQKVSETSQKDKANRNDSIARLMNHFLIGNTTNETYTLNPSISLQEKQTYIGKQLSAFTDLVNNPDDISAQEDASTHELKGKHGIVLEQIEGKNGIYRFKNRYPN